MEIIERARANSEVEQIPIDFIPAQYRSRVRKFKRRHWVMVLIFAIASSVVVGIVTSHQIQERSALVHGQLALQGGVALSAVELRSVLLENGINAYWVGQKAKFSYVLDASLKGQAVVRYLPEGARIESSPAEDLTIVTTYVQKKAYSTVLDAGMRSPITSFINVDGNAVYSDAAYPKLAYMGIKGKDIQVEIYDPHPGTALFLAQESQQVFAIK